MAEANDALQDVLGGAMAYGWTYSGSGRLDLAAEPMRGWIRLHDHGYLEYEALVDDPYDDQVGLRQGAAPNALFLSTRHGTLLLPYLFPRVGWQHNYGGFRASVNLYRSDVALFGVDPEKLLSNRVQRISVRFYGMGPWAGMNLTEVKVTHKPGGNRVQQAELKLRSAPSKHLASKLPRNLSITLEGDWVLGSEKGGKQEAKTALRVVLEAKRARKVADLTVVLGDIQDLLAILRGGLTPAATSNLGSEAGESVLFWSADLMRPAARSRVAAVGEHLRLSLGQIGGLSGVAAWCRLAEEHRDVVEALTTLYRDGPSTVEMTLLRLGVAVELWVARHARTAWGSRKNRPKGWTHAHSLAHHLGPGFARLVGDVDNWATRFTDAYNDTKHHTGRQKQPELEHALARTARIALTAELLNRARGSRAAGDAWMREWHSKQVGEHYQSLP